MIFPQFNTIEFQLYFAFCLNQIGHLVPELCSIEGVKATKKLDKIAFCLYFYMRFILLYFVVFKR